METPTEPSRRLESKTLTSDRRSQSDHLGAHQRSVLRLPGLAFFTHPLHLVHSRCHFSAHSRILPPPPTYITDAYCRAGFFVLSTSLHLTHRCQHKTLCLLKPFSCLQAELRTSSRLCCGQRKKPLLQRRGRVLFLVKDSTFKSAAALRLGRNPLCGGLRFALLFL